jgi:hypothetical protein
MAEFNVDDYFANLQRRGAADELANPTQDKLLSLQHASEEKIRQLAEMSAITRTAELTAAKAQKEFFINQIGLDTTSFTGSAINGVVEAFAGFSKNVVGSLVGLPPAIVAAYKQGTLTEQDIAALGRHEKGSASPEDMAQINRKMARQIPINPSLPNDPGRIKAQARAQAIADLDPDSATPLSVWKEMNAARTMSTNINEAFDRSSLIDKTDRNAMDAQLGREAAPAIDQLGKGVDAIQSGDYAGGTADAVSALGQLIYHGATAAAQNPRATLGYVLENAPQLLVGGLAGKAGSTILGATNIGYAVDQYNQGIQNYQQANGGAMPPEEQRQTMALQAASLAAAEQVGDLVTLGVGKMGAKAAQDIGRTSVTGALKKVAVATGEGVLAEAPTEGFQTYMEGEVTGKPVTAMDIYKGAVIGGASGGGLAGGMRTAHEAAVLASQPGAPKGDKPVDPKFEESIATGNVDHLLDPKSDSYAPQDAIRALFGHSQQAGTTEETKVANLAKADDIVSKLGDELLTVQEQLITPEKLQAKVDKYKEVLDKTDPANTDRVEALQSAIAGAEQDLTKPTLSGPDQARLTAQATKLERLAEEASVARDSLALLVHPKATVDAMVEAANQPAVAGEDNTPAIHKVITLAMASPGHLDPKVAAQLADNKANALTAPQREMLRSFSEARIAENKLMTLGAVSADIFIGRKNKGIAQYRVAIGNALATGNQKAADREMASLAKFDVDHTAKAVAVTKAYTAFQKDGQHRVVRSDGAQGWFVEIAPPMGELARAKEGALNIGKGAAELAHNIPLEADAITKVVAESRAAYSLKFNPGATNVAHVSQETPGAKASPAVTQKRAVTKAGSGSTAVNPSVVSDKAGAGKSAPASAVESTGVTQKTESTASTEETNVSSVKTESTKTTDTTTVNSKSTEDTTVQTESTSDTADKGSDAPAAVKPGLDALLQGREFNKQFTGKKLGEVFRQLNRAAAWLTQRQPKVKKDADILAVRPLIDINDFLVQWNAGDVTSDTFFPTDLTETQQDALTAFRKTATKWFAGIKENFIYGSLPNSKGNTVEPKWTFQDPLQNFFTQDGKIDPNIVTAVAYAAYAWYAETAGGSPRLTDKGILAMHGLQEGQGVSVNPEGGDTLRLMASTRDQAITSLGSRIVEALGLSERPGVDVPQGYMSVVTAAFGAHALRLLEDQDLVAFKTLDGGELNRYMDGMDHQPTGTRRGKDSQGNPIDIDVYEEWHYVQLNRQDDLSLVANGQQIKDASSGSQGVLNKLFGSTRPLREATTEPTAFRQDKAKRTDQGISTEQLDVMDAAQDAPHRVIKSMWGALQVLGDNVFLTAAGARENENHLVQYENRDAVNAQNDSLIHQLDLAKELVQPHADRNALDQAFFVTQEVWRNFRAGIVTQNLNMQSSKIHRAMFFRPEWEATIRLDDPVAMEQFQVGLAQALGIKVDTQPNDQTIEKLRDFLADPSHRIVELALKLHWDIENPDKGLLTEADKELIGEFAAKREGMQTLQAVVALGEYLTALQTGNESAKFTVHMLVGADGKTNGPMLTILALGAAQTVEKLFGYLNRGGFYRESDGVSNFSHWYDPAKKQDLYQDFAGKILQKLNMASPKATALQVITKDLLKDGGVTSAARNLAKTPQTGFNFGSSVQTAVLGMQESLVKAVFDCIEAVATGEEQWIKPPELIASINAFIAQPALKIPTNTTIQELMDMRFSKQQKKALLLGFGSLLGPVVEETMEEYYGTLITRRNALNKSVQAAFHIYNTIYTDLREQEMQRLMDEGYIAFDPVVDKDGKPKLDAKGNPRRTPLHDMSVTQEKALIERVKPLLPVAHSAYSKDEKNLDVGLLMAKTQRAKGTDSFYGIKVQFGRKFKDVRGRMTSALQATGMTRVMTSPGVAALAYFMHSLDSAVMHRSIAGTESMNIHDETANAADKINKTAGAINASLWSTMLKFSPLTETLDLLGRSVTNSIPLLESGDLSESTIVVLADMLRQTLPAKKDAIWGQKTTNTVDLALAALTLAKQNQYAAETVRLTGMSQMTAVDQYTWEGGEYRVTEEDRAEAKALLDAHLKAGPALDPALVQAALKFGKLLAKAGEAKPQVSKRAVVEQEPELKTPPVAKVPVATKATTTTNSVLAAFKKTPKMPARDALTAAWNSVQKDGDMSANMRAFYGKLIPRMAGLLPKNLIIEYVNSQEKFDELVEMGLGPPAHMGQNIYGWHAGDAQRIFIMGDVFPVSKVNSELIIHELLHGVTAAAIYEAKPGTPAYALVQDLEHILDAARKFVAKLPQEKQNQFRHALENVHEVLAWGMTNSAFQTEVLAKIQVKSKSYPNKLVTLAQQFAEALANFFFKGNPGSFPWEYVSGMELLISTVAGLTEDTGSQEQSQTEQAPVSSTASDTDSLADAIDASMDYLNNPPDNYSITGLGDRLDWAEKQKKRVAADLAKIEAGIDSPEFDHDHYDEVSELSQDLRLLIQEIKAAIQNENDMVEADKKNGTNLFGQNPDLNQADQLRSLAMAAPQPQDDPLSAINAYSTLDLLNAMDNGTLEAPFQDHLRDLLGGMVQKLHGPFGSFMASMRKNEAGSPMGVWLKALETGKAPFTSSILASGFTGNNQQDFVMQQVEATVRASFTANDVTTRTAYRELDKLFHETAARLKPADFLGGTWGTHSMTEAQALYDFVFNVQQTNGHRSDYLSRFAALGLAHQGFNALLRVPTQGKTVAANRGVIQKLNDIFHSILEFFHSRLTGTYTGQDADAKLTALVNHLVDIEAKQRYVLAQEASAWSQFVEPIEQGAEQVVKVAHRKITSVLGSDTLRAHKSALVRGTFSLLRSVTRSRIDGFLQSAIRFRDTQTKGQQGLLAGLISNVKSPTESFKLLLMATKLNERKRAQEVSHNSKFILESFANKGLGMSKQAKSAITSVFLRTGLHALVGPMTLVEIENLMGNDAAITKAIEKFKSKLDEFGALKDNFSLDANYLGYHTVTGLNPSRVLKLNATQIARQFGGTQNLTDAQVARAVEAITPLIALYALRYLSNVKSTDKAPSPLALAKELLRIENNRPADQSHGVEVTLQLARHLELEALDRLFDGDPALMVHGYTPEIYNYRTALVSANEADGKELMNLGYVKGGLAQKDPADPDREVKHLYKLADGGLPPRVTGAVVASSENAKGSLAHGSHMNLLTINGIANQMTAAAIQSHRAQAIAKTVVGNPDRDVSKEPDNFMAPLFNDSGAVANWRYLMASSTKDTLLERTNDFDKLLGTLAGTILSKPAQLEQNKIAIQTMADQYNSEYATRGNIYEEIGPKSSDPDMREIWALLPEQTKADVRDIWGSEKLMVRSDSLDLLFGYSKVQGAAPIQRAYEERRDKGLAHTSKSLNDLTSINVAQKVLIGVAEMLLYSHARSVKRMSPEDAQNYTKRLGHWVATGENIWQAIVHETKDILVVKTGATMVGNILSNFSMLWLQGVPMSKMITDTFVALRAATEHKADSDELAKLRLQLETGATQGRDTEIKRRIAILENALERNPATKLINEGLMPTIVEDLADDEDVYSYKHLLARKVDTLASKVNPSVIKAARTLYMAHDTPLYRGLSHVTQMSDFLARYVLYQHQTTRKKDPLTHKEAILRASDAFVNYDIPMHRSMQYSDDMGFTVFTKYFLYIQRELWRAGREHPARLYSMMTLSHYLNIGPIVLDSGMQRHMFNNPFRGGVFNFVGSLYQLLTVKAALAVVK